MNEEWNIPEELPLDVDGFLSRECPLCAFEFKWFSDQETQQEQDELSQYFCPRCGVPAGLDKWWTPQQLELIEYFANIAVLNQFTDAMNHWNKSTTGSNLINIGVTSDSNVKASKPNLSDYETDMFIVESPCHPQESIKVPVKQLTQVHCLACGLLFAV